MGKPEHCGTCSLRFEIKRLPSVEGEDGEYHVQMLDFPVLTCPANHERWYLYDDFGPDLIETLYNKNKTFFAERKGFLRHRDYCARCHRIFDTVEETKQTIEIPMQMKNAHHFVLKVSGPALTCTACNTRQFRDVQQRTSVISEALANALTGASIRPR
jgi:hypothetical protein